MRKEMRMRIKKEIDRHFIYIFLGPVVGSYSQIFTLPLVCFLQKYII